MESNEFMRKAKRLVACDLGDLYANVSIVWYSWVLGSQKAMLITPDNGDGLIFEVTFDKSKGEFYVNRYAKVHNTGVENWED